MKARSIKGAVLLLPIITLSLVLRLFWLDRIPSGISDDELDYVFTAKSIFLSGHDVTNTWHPLSLRTPPLEVPKAELPYAVIAPIIGPMPFSLFWARFPFVLVGVILVVITSVLAKTLISPKAGYVAGIIAAINPWYIYFARTAFDAPMAVTWMYIGAYILFWQTGWRVLFSFIFFFLGFYSYIGLKVVFLPFIIILTIGAYVLKKTSKNLAPLIAVLLLSVGLFSYFLTTAGSGKISGRFSELSTPNNVTIVEAVNTKRRLTIDNNFVHIASNKLTEYLHNRLEVYFNFFSPQYLFLHGDRRSSFSLWEHGVLYPIDALFLFLGIVTLFATRKKVFVVLMLLLLVAPLPSLVSNQGSTYSIRASLAFPIFVIITAAGITYAVQTLKRWKYIGAAVLLIVYMLSTANFLYLYFYRNPVYNSEGFAVSQRIVSRYIDIALRHNQRIYILTDGTATLLRQYVFFYNLLNKNTMTSVARVLSRSALAYENIILGDCSILSSISNNDVIISGSSGYCGETKRNHVTIAQLADGGEIYQIYNDTVCSKYPLSTYPQIANIHDLLIEQMSDKKFCQTYITNFAPLLPT